MPLTCIQCGKQTTEELRQTVPLEFGDLSYVGEIPCQSCECGWVHREGDVVGAFEHHVAHLLAERPRPLPGRAVLFMYRAFGLTRRAICELISINDATLSAWERGEQQDCREFAFFCDWVRGTAKKSPWQIREKTENEARK